MRTIIDSCWLRCYWKNGGGFSDLVCLIRCIWSSWCLRAVAVMAACVVVAATVRKAGRLCVDCLPMRRSRCQNHEEAISTRCERGHSRRRQQWSSGHPPLSLTLGELPHSRSLAWPILVGKSGWRINRAYEETVKCKRNLLEVPRGAWSPSATVVFKWLASLLSMKLDQPYSRTLTFRCTVTFSLLDSVIMCLRGPRSSFHRPAHDTNVQDQPLDLIVSEAWLFDWLVLFLLLLLLSAL